MIYEFAEKTKTEKKKKKKTRARSLGHLHEISFSPVYLYLVHMFPARAGSQGAAGFQDVPDFLRQ